MLHTASLAACAAALIAMASGCRADTGPVGGAPVALLVSNATCATGACATIRVLAFPADQPITPGGMWSIVLGDVSGASACLTIPPSASFRVTDSGSGATTTTTWTTTRKLSLGAISQAQSPLQASPSTEQFVPATRAGWSVTLPGTASPASSAACQ